MVFPFSPFAVRFMGVALAAALVFPDAAHAAWTITDGQPATDVLGQYNGLGQPVFTKGNPNDGPNKRGFYTPEGIAVDEIHHRLFVADTTNNRVLVYDLNSQNGLMDHVPDHVLGQVDFTSRASDATSSGMLRPNGLAYDGVGQRLFVADLGHNRVLVFDVTAITDGENAVNVLGQTDFTSVASSIGPGRMSWPAGLAYDSGGGRLFVCDQQNSRVLVFDVASVTNGENAVNVLGQVDFLSGVPAVGGSPNGLWNPQGLAYDSGGDRLFVCDQQNNRVLVFDVATITNGENAVNVLGQASFTSVVAALTQSGMKSPKGLAFDGAGQRLFVSDFLNSRVLVFSVAAITNGENAVNVLGQANFTSGVESTARGAMSYPSGLTYVNTSNKLFTLETSNNRVLVFDTASITNGENAVDLLGHMGSDGQLDYTVRGPNGGADRFGFSSPSSVAIDSPGHRLFVLDRENNRVLVYNLSRTNELTDKTPDYVLGQPDFTSDAAVTTRNGMSSPMGLVYDEGGRRLFVADYSNSRVLVFSVAAISNGENAVNVLGQANFTSNALSVTKAGLSFPYGLAYDLVRRRLFVANHNRISVFDVAAITNGEDAVNVLGQVDFTSSGPATTPNGLWNPTGLACDSGGGRLFVSDIGNNRVLMFNVTSITNGENAVHVLGQADFTSSVPGITQARLNNPCGLIYDSAGQRLFVVDRNSNRILVFDVATITNGENAVNVLGQVDFTSGFSSITPSGLRIPQDLSYDPIYQRLFVTDAGNHRIMVYGEGSSALDPIQNARGYPSPFRPGRGDTAMTFDLMPGNARVRVYTMTGALVRELRADGGGVATWDVRTSEGRPAASGVYWVVCEGDGGKKTTKVIVQR